jgi:hypothetical protein
MSTAPNPQTTDNIELIPVCNYSFAGDNRTVENKRTFISWYRRKASIFHAAVATQVARSTIYKWIEDDPQFALAVEESFEDAVDVMETSTYEDALGSNGKPGNPLLKMFWLKAHRHKYRDKVTIDLDVVKDEIVRRMQQLNLQQLPPAVTRFIDVESSESQTVESLVSRED